MPQNTISQQKRKKNYKTLEFNGLRREGPRRKSLIFRNLRCGRYYSENCLFLIWIFISESGKNVFERTVANNIVECVNERNFNRPLCVSKAKGDSLSIQPVGDGTKLAKALDF